MKNLRVLLVACSFLSFSACYDFNFPLDPAPRVPVDGRLLGVWRCLATEEDVDEPALTLAISRRTEHVTRWRVVPDSKEAGGETEDVGEYDIHGSTVKGGYLLSAQEVRADRPGDWSFVRYTFLVPGVLRVQLVHDEPFKDVRTNAAKVRKEVEKRREDPAIYEDFLVCVRAKPSEAPSPTPSPTPGL